MSWGSLEERKRAFLEDCCGGGGGDAGGPTSMVGADGYQADAPAAGPRAGYDPLMSKLKRIRNNKRRRAEG